MSEQSAKCHVFSELHQEHQAWVIPNPWDAGSAKLLQGLGFKALATTSAGLAFTLGKTDGTVTLEEKLDHCRLIASVTRIPVNVDFENGHAENLKEMGANIHRLIETGIAGLSIEDFSRENRALYEFQEAVERVQAASECIRESNVPVVLTARAENLLRGSSDLDDTIARLQAFAKAGADVLYAPGISSLDQLRVVCAEIPRPFNVLATFLPDATLKEFTEAGATRVSTGGALTWAAVAALLEAGSEMSQSGSFGWLRKTANRTIINELLD